MQHGYKKHHRGGGVGCLRPSPRYEAFLGWQPNWTPRWWFLFKHAMGAIGNRLWLAHPVWKVHREVRYWASTLSFYRFFQAFGAGAVSDALGWQTSWSLSNPNPAVSSTMYLPKIARASGKTHVLVWITLKNLSLSLYLATSPYFKCSSGKLHVKAAKPDDF